MNSIIFVSPSAAAKPTIPENDLLLPGCLIWTPSNNYLSRDPHSQHCDKTDPHSVHEHG